MFHQFPSCFQWILARITKETRLQHEAHGQNAGGSRGFLAQAAAQSRAARDLVGGDCLQGNRAENGKTRGISGIRMGMGRLPVTGNDDF